MAIGAAGALVLLVLGEVGLAQLPVDVSIDVQGATGQVTLEGDTHSISVPDLPPGAHLAFEAPGPTQREYQIDGSDTTSRNDLDADEFKAVQDAPWYRFMAWLRDEGSYSRWQDVRLTDLNTGAVIATGTDAVGASALPGAFRIDASLRRPESPARIWLERRDGSKLVGLTLDRDLHQALWQQGDNDTKPTTWFFPNNVGPFAAELTQLAGRSAVAAFVLLAAMCGLAWVAARKWSPTWRWQALDGFQQVRPARGVGVGIAAIWFTAALWVTVRLYHQLPHIVDAQAYYFQARIFETGRTWLQIPDMVSRLDGFQQVEWNGRWFAQYPPGAPALYALGGLAGLAWLVGPLATLTMLVATAIAGTLLFDRWVGLTALGLLALSPFVLFQAGSFMSHPISGGAVACALAAFAYAWRTDRRWAYLAIGAALGLAFMTREVAAVLYGLVLGGALVLGRRWRGLPWIVVAALPFLVAYVLFNLSTTGDLLTLPRNLFNPSDRWGFGDVGPSGHTLAAGLVNTDENLTLLQFDLFGWPPLAALALISMPFLLGRAGRFDWLLAACAGAFVLAYVGYFYPGIALGPRYYFEAVPALALLGARGLQVCVQTLRSLGLGLGPARVGVGVVLGVLCAWTVGYYLPHAVNRRMDYGALSNDQRLVMPFVQTTLTGPQVTEVQPPALVMVPNGDVFKALSALNCPLLEDAYLNACPVLFVNGNLDDAAPLYAQFPGRSVWLVDTNGDLVTLQRVRNSTT